MKLAGSEEPLVRDLGLETWGWRPGVGDLGLETWDEIAQAVEAATAYWNAHRHPFIWGRRRRHRPRRKAGLAILPTAA